MNILPNAPLKRGRPCKMKDKIFFEDCSSRTLKLLSSKIATELRLSPSWFTDRLAEAGIAYKCTAQARNEAPLAVSRQGRRPNTHLSILLWDIARIVQIMGLGDADKVLKKLNGYNEERAKIKGEPSTAIADQLLRAVLAALGERNPSSLRRQAANALKIRKIRMI